MVRAKFILLILMGVVLGQSHALATNYYFSNKGNDSNSGKSKTAPWLSLQKLNATKHLFQAGDSILFLRGDTFRGQVEISTSGIYIGAYGSGLKPVLSGLVEINNWTFVGKNIWKANCHDCVTEPANILINGKFQPLGRYPNKGYLTITGTSPSDRVFSDATLRFANGYWDNAEVVVRSSRWTLDNLPITIYKDKTFHAAVPSTYLLQNGFGYFIQKHFSTLDEPGEWFFDPSTNQIFLYIAPTAKPSDFIIEVSVYELGLSVANAHHVTIENLTFMGNSIAGVRLKNSTDIKLHHVDILSSGKNGLEVISCTNLQVKENRISDSNNNGVVWHDTEGGSFSHNTILRTGVHAGRGVSGNGTYIALHITADKRLQESNLFEHNTIDSAGYSGIDFRTGHTDIKNNRISNFCMIKDDGAGVYTWNNTKGDNCIEGNTIFNGMGTGEGTTQSSHLYASGIYIDDLSSHILIVHNAVSNCATAGVFLHNAKHITVVGNTLFGNGNSISNKEKGQLYIKLDTLGRFAGNTALQLEVTENILAAANDATHCIYLSADKQRDLRQLGTFTNNQFRARHLQHAVGESYNQVSLCAAPEEFTLAEWQQTSHYENGSTFETLLSKSTFVTMGKNLIHNGSMTADINGWMVWPEKSNLLQEKIKIKDGPSLKINIPVKNEALLYQAGFSLSKNKLYRLSFTLMSAQPTTIEFVPLMAQTPWKALGDYTCFSSNSTYKTFTYFFRPTTSSADARVNFKSNTTFWIDSVSLYEVDESTAKE